MHLAIEAVGIKHSGGAVVLNDVLIAATASAAIGEITVFCSPLGMRRINFPESSKITTVEMRGPEENLIRRILWLSKGLKNEASSRGADVLLCMSGMGSSVAASAIFIQQALPFCPEALRVCGWRDRLRMAFIRTLMKRSCRGAALIITQTATMSRWIQSDFGVDPSRITVVNPWGRRLGMSANAGGLSLMEEVPAGKRLLYAGNTSRYKNLSCLTSGLAEVRRLFPGTVLFLTCPPNHPLCRAEGVVGLGYLSADELNRAYRLATIFVTASLVESGNLTLVEAMTAGTPILAADRPYARELCEDAAQYFDPLDPGSFADSAANLLRDGNKRRIMAIRGIELAARGYRSNPYGKLIEQLVALAKNGDELKSLPLAGFARAQQNS